MMRELFRLSSRWNVGLVASLFFSTALAKYNTSDTLRTTPKNFPRPRTPQFQNWYPHYSSHLEVISTTICNTSRNDYNTFYHAPPDSLEASHLLTACYLLEDCILENLTAVNTADFNGAYVLLGLLPTLLDAIGPSVAEISILSVHRPFLSFLISLGAPAVFPTRLFEYTNPLLTIKREKNRFAVSRLPSKLAIFISISEYGLAIGAVANVISTSVRIGQNSILSWGYTTTFTPLLWTSLACVIHVVAASSYMMARKVTKKRLSQTPRAAASSDAMSKDGRPQISLSSMLKALYMVLKDEFILCANRHTEAPTDDEIQAEVPRMTVLLNVLAGIMGSIHITFGIMIFSSTLFVGIWDVLIRILIRYLASSVVARLVLLFELAGLRSES